MLIKVRGLGSISNAPPLADFTQSMIEKGVSRFAVELSECDGMDSTFMGTLVGIAQTMRSRPGGWICMLNVSGANRDLLKIVGADRFFAFDARAGVTRDLRMQPLPSLKVSPERRIELVRKAHENLVEIDARNERKFGALLRSLTSELDRKASESGLFDGEGR